MRSRPAKPLALVPGRIVLVPGGIEQKERRTNRPICVPLT
jgi:hypothetical protein